MEERFEGGERDDVSKLAHLVVFQVRGRMLARLLVADCLWESRAMSNGPEGPRVDDDNWWNGWKIRLDSVNELIFRTNLRIFRKIV